MSEEKGRNPRARDDTHLRKLVSETRQWMKDQGIQEKPLDWDAIRAEQRARWWRGRLRNALAGLASHAPQVPMAAAKLVRELAGAPESLAQAAFEVTMAAAQRTARILLEPARACVAPDARLDFSYASEAERSRLGLPAGNQESMGVFLSAAIPGAQVIADAAARTVTVEFLREAPASLVLLVPEDAGQPVRVAAATPSVFPGVDEGTFLLCAYPAGEAEP